MTIWKPVVGYESQYEASSAGEIRSIRNDRNSKAGHVLRPSNRSGYLGVSLCQEGRVKNCLVHRVITAAFLGPPGDKHVNHINGNKHDNRVENLEYVTRAQNEQHKHQHLLSGRGDGVVAKLSADQVEEMRQLRQQGWTYKRLAEKFLVCLSNAHAVCSRSTWKRI